jgi:plasmid stabilization system protein ParE
VKKTNPLVSFTDAAERDLDRYSIFLSRKGVRRPQRRIRELRREAELIANDPKLYPIDWTHPVSLLDFRRKNVDQFVIFYVHFEPTASMPDGLVSVRAVRHGAEQDVRLRVEEPKARWFLERATITHARCHTE